MQADRPAENYLGENSGRNSVGLSEQRTGLVTGGLDGAGKSVEDTTTYETVPARGYHPSRLTLLFYWDLSFTRFGIKLYFYLYKFVFSVSVWAAPTGRYTLYNTQVRPIVGRDAGAGVY